MNKEIVNAKVILYDFGFSTDPDAITIISTANSTNSTNSTGLAALFDGDCCCCCTNDTIIVANFTLVGVISGNNTVIEEYLISSASLGVIGSARKIMRAEPVPNQINMCAVLLSVTLEITLTGSTSSGSLSDPFKILQVKIVSNDADYDSSLCCVLSKRTILEWSITNPFIPGETEQNVNNDPFTYSSPLRMTFLGNGTGFFTVTYRALLTRCHELFDVCNPCIILLAPSTSTSGGDITPGDDDFDESDDDEELLYLEDTNKDILDNSVNNTINDKYPEGNKILKENVKEEIKKRKINKF